MVWVKTERPLCVDEAPVHITVTEAKMHVRWIKYVQPKEPHEPEALLGVIDGHVVVWLWGPEDFDDFMCHLVAQAKRDSFLTMEDVVALVKLRSENVQKWTNG